jgi:hypothetical protein
VGANGGTHDGAAVSLTHPTAGEFAWIAIVVAIGVVQVVRAQWFDAGVFAAAAVALAADATGRLSAATSRRRVTVRVIVIACAIATVILSFLPRHSPAMIVAVVTLGVMTIALVWPRPSRRDRWPHGVRVLAWWWAAILVTGCLWELAQFIIGLFVPSTDGALSDLLEPVLETPLGQFVCATAWVAVGLFLVLRVVRR